MTNTLLHLTLRAELRVTTYGVQAMQDKHERQVTIDGNDGTGKSSVVAELTKIGYIVSDRGLATRLTDNPDLPVAGSGIHIILDAPIETSQKRLAQAGRSLTEKYHTPEDLRYYRERFLAVAALLPNTTIIDANRALDCVVEDCVRFLISQGMFPSRT